MTREAKIIPIERGRALRREASRAATAKACDRRRQKLRGVIRDQRRLSQILWIAIGLSALIWTYSQLPSDLAKESGYFRTCADAHARGVYNIPHNDSRYRAELDAEGDGFACEPIPRR